MADKTGKRSAASYIEKMLDLAWCLGIVFGVLLIVWQVYLLFASPGWLDESMRMKIVTPWLVLSFTEGFSAPDIGSLFVYQFALILPFLAMGLLIIFHLKKIFATITEGDPFSMENRKRIKVIGWTVITVTVLRALLYLFLGQYISTLVDLPGLVLTANIRLDDLSGVFLGIVILIIAEVFEHGSRLQEESKLTV